MSELKTVMLSSIDPNPMRELAKYPYNEKKITTLIRSISDVGLWEGVIARKKSGRYQIAFGHHRIEAARRKLGKDGRAVIIVKDLTDTQMIQLMGRENLEDYNADFLIMLESWGAGARFLEHDRAQKPEDIEVARLLGWTRRQPGERTDTRLDSTASACAKAHRLISGGYMSRSDLADLSVFNVRELVDRVVAQHEAVEKMAKATNRPFSEVERTKKVSGKAGSQVAKDIREGKVAQRDIKGQVDVRAYRHARDAKKQTPLFTMFGSRLADQIGKVCKEDSIAEKFHDIEKALGNITFQEDIEVVRRIALECGHASERFGKWQTTFTNPKRKVVKLEVTRG